MRHLRDVRSLVLFKQVGIFAAIFSLLAQPLGMLPIDSAFAAPITDKVVINEVDPFSDQVELYNGTASAVAMTGWSLTEYVPATGAPGATVSINQSIPAGGYAVIGVANINNTGGDRLRLVRADASEDNVVFGTVTGQAVSDAALPAAGQTVQRNGNGEPSWTTAAGTLGAANVNTPVAGPSAILSSNLPGVATLNTPTAPFTAEMSNVANASGVNVRVKTVITGGSASDVVFEYLENQGPSAGTYQLLDYTGGAYYFGPSTGFPLQNATSTLRITFKQVGTYTATSEVINVADNSVIGDPVIKTVEVSAPVATRYVAPTGSDAVNDCLTQASPCLTIQHAVNQANAGDTIQVAAGNYTGTVTVNKSLYIEGAQAGNDARPAAGRTAASAGESVLTVAKNQRAFSIAANNVTIDGFVVKQDGGLGASDAIKADNSLSDVTVKNNIVLNATDEAIQLEAGTNYLIENNYVLNSIGDGITLSTYAPLKGSNLQILNNEISGSTSAAGSIYLYGAQNVTVKGNKITTKSTGIAAGTYPERVSNVTIEDNIIDTELKTAYSALVTGIGVDGSSDNVTIQRNTITQIGGIVSSAESAYPERFNLIRVGVALAANPSGVVIKHNNLSRITPVNYVYVNPTVTNVVDALQNWWGTYEATEVENRINDTQKVEYEPWLCQPFNVSLRESVNGMCDQSAPEVTVNNPGTASNLSDLEITGTVKDDESSITEVKVVIDGVDYVGTVSGEDWTITVPADTLQEGTYTVEATATNSAGLITSPAATGTLVIDRTAPTASVVVAPTSPVMYGSSVQFSGQIDNYIAGDTLQVCYSGGSFGNCDPVTVASDGSWSYTTGPMNVAGTYQFYVVVSDMYGNEAPTLLSPYTVRVDPFAPAPLQIITNENIQSVRRPTSSVPRTTYVADVNTGTTGDEDGTILGTKTTKPTDKTPTAAIEPSEEGWRLWGLAWYWWVGIVGALGAVGWASMSWLRGRGQA